MTLMRTKTRMPDDRWYCCPHAISQGAKVAAAQPAPKCLVHRLRPATAASVLLRNRACHVLLKLCRTQTHPRDGCHRLTRRRAEHKARARQFPSTSLAALAKLVRQRRLVLRHGMAVVVTGCLRAPVARCQKHFALPAAGLLPSAARLSRRSPLRTAMQWRLTQR